MESIYFKESSKIKIKQKSENFLVYFYVIAFSLLLFIRDYVGVGINKYLFVGLTFCVVASLDLKKTLCIFCFLMPLYVGLPGNYMTFIFFAKFLLSWKDFKFSSGLLLSVVLACSFMFLQNLFFSATDISQMAVIPGLIIVVFLFAYVGELDKNNMIIMFALGVAVTGLIMLMITLKENGLEDIISSTSRLGDDALIVSEANMFVSLDPNYYGLFAISAISVAFPLLFEKISKGTKTFLLIVLFASLAVALIGLSRAFVLVLVLWAFSILITQSKLKNIMLSLFVIILVTIIVFIVFPDVLDAITERFKGDDMADGNGRITIINEFVPMWLENISTFMLGVGMYECNVHCMPLQIVFGGGLIYSLIMLLYFASLLQACRVNKVKRKFTHYVPMLLTFVMTCTVPIATSLTFMFPFVISIYSLKGEKCVEAN